MLRAGVATRIAIHTGEHVLSIHLTTFGTLHLIVPILAEMLNIDAVSIVQVIHREIARSRERLCMITLAKFVRLSVMYTAAALILTGTASTKDISKKLVVPGEDKLQQVTLKDGSKLIGRITEVTDNDVKFKTDLGEMTIDRSKINDIVEIPLSSFRDGKYWFPNPNQTRLLIGPTARTLRKGEGYFVDLWIFFPGVSYGLTDNITIGGGVSIIPGIDHQLFYLTPKIGFGVNEKLDVAATIMIFRLWDETAYLGIGNLTYGTEDLSITGGLGLAWNDAEMADDPAGTLGGEFRFARRMSLVAESWFIPGNSESGTLGMGALRLFGEQMAVDIGLAYSFDEKKNSSSDPNFEEDNTSWIPYIDFVWNF